MLCVSCSQWLRSDRSPLLQLPFASTKKRVMLPLVVLRDHEDFDPLGDGTADPPEFQRLW